MLVISTTNAVAMLAVNRWNLALFEHGPDRFRQEWADPFLNRSAKLLESS